MAEEIRPVGIYRPRRLKPTAREDREENDQRFRNQLTQFGRDEQSGDDAHPERDDASDVNAPAEADARTAHIPPPNVGRNLDVRT